MIKLDQKIAGLLNTTMSTCWLLMLALGVGSLPLTTEAYIPPSKMILSRLVENHGNGYYQIEQELQFVMGSEVLSVRETWFSAGEKGLRLVAVGQNSLKDKFYYQAQYSGTQKLSFNGTQKITQKIPAEMSERPFHLRTSESFIQWLISLNILPDNYARTKPYSREKDNFIYPVEPFLRLGRTAGVITYVFGAETKGSPEKSQPGLWIEQDLFHIRKIRWPSQSELTIEELGNYSRHLVFPKIRNLRWDNKEVQMVTLSVTSKPLSSQNLQTLNLDPKHQNILEGLQQNSVLADFYKRFR